MEFVHSSDEFDALDKHRFYHSVLMDCQFRQAVVSDAIRAEGARYNLTELPTSELLATWYEKYPRALRWKTPTRFDTRGFAQQVADYRALYGGTWHLAIYEIGKKFGLMPYPGISTVNAWIKKYSIIPTTKESEQLDQIVTSVDAMINLPVPNLAGDPKLSDLLQAVKRVDDIRSRLVRRIATLTNTVCKNLASTGSSRYSPE